MRDLVIQTVNLWEQQCRERARSPGRVPEKSNVPLLPELSTQAGLIRLLQGLADVDSPRFWGHMTTPSTESQALADLLISLTHQNVVKEETAGTAAQLEEEVIRYFLELTFGSSGSAMGWGTSGGTIANLTALWAAKERAGSDAVPEIWVSERGHYSLEKAARILDLKLRRFPVNSDHQICLNTLKQAIQLKRHAPVILVGIAGSTETGSIDDLEALTEIASDQQWWFHVDAAWGGPFLFSSEIAHRLRGIAQARSVTWDAHKLLMTGLGWGMVLFSNRSDAERVRTHAEYIVREGSNDLGQWGLEGSRPFHALRVAWLLAHDGKEAIAARVEHSFRLTQAIGEWIQREPDLELTSPVISNILTYRFRNLSDEDHIALQEHQKRNGMHFVSRTRLSAGPENSQHKRVVLRIVPSHPEQSLALFQECVQEQRVAITKNLNATFGN